jgi:hypothetical protein
VNPGTRVVIGKLGEQVVTQEVSVAEGENRTVELKFGAAPAAAAPEPAPAAPAPRPPPAAPPPAAPPPADAGTDRGATQRLGAYVSLGVGGAGILVGTITGFLVLGKKGDLEDAGCVDYHCYTTQQDDVDSMNSLRTISTVSFVVGAVGAAAGVTLLLTAPKADQNVALTVGPQWAGVHGRF